MSRLFYKMGITNIFDHLERERVDINSHDVNDLIAYCCNYSVKGVGVGKATHPQNFPQIQHMIQRLAALTMLPYTRLIKHKAETSCVRAWKVFLAPTDEEWKPIKEMSWR
jgi:hypothetical protein